MAVADAEEAEEAESEDAATPLSPAAQELRSTANDSQMKQGRLGLCEGAQARLSSELSGGEGLEGMRRSHASSKLQSLQLTAERSVPLPVMKGSQPGLPKGTFHGAICMLSGGGAKVKGKLKVRLVLFDFWIVVLPQSLAQAVPHAH